MDFQAIPAGEACRQRGARGCACTRLSTRRKKEPREGGKVPERVNYLTVQGRAPGCPFKAAYRNPGQPGPLGYRLMFISSAIMASVVVMTLALAW